MLHCSQFKLYIASLTLFDNPLIINLLSKVSFPVKRQKNATVSTTFKSLDYSTFKLQTYNGILRDIALHFLGRLTLGISKCVKIVIQRYTNLNNPGYWSKLTAPINWIKQNSPVFMFHTQSCNYSTRTSNYFEAVSQTDFKPSIIK